MDNRDAILKTIDKIAQLSKRPGNEWLFEELKRKWGESNTEQSTTDSERIKEIHDYLLLDNWTEQIYSVAGYDYVDMPEKPSFREKMVSDWREMKRYRYGIANRPISYVDFCSHAHFQAEGIVNYYHYKIKDGVCDIDWFNENIDEYVNRFKDNGFKLDRITRMKKNGMPTTLEDVNYNTKKCVLFNQMEKQKIIKPYKTTEISQILTHIQKVRNTEAVHRSTSASEAPNKTYSYEAIEYAVSELNNVVKIMTSVREE